ncbi:MAG: universal stress protein [Chthoniobacterales bacterium]|nr:universal stress protein [Chthoniobacterales bacterium]
MKTILVAVDLSPASSKVLKEAVGLAEELSAKILLLHVIAPVSSAVPVGSSMEMVSVPLPLSAGEIAEVKSRLNQLAASVASPKSHIETSVKEALPVEEIKHQVEATGASLLVVGSHGHGGLYHLFNGSVVTELLKQATKPVLVVPARN